MAIDDYYTDFADHGGEANAEASAYADFRWAFEEYLADRGMVESQDEEDESWS